MRQKALFSTSALVGMLFSVSVAFTWGPTYLAHQWEFKKDKDKPKKEKKDQKAQKTQINFKSWEDVGPNNLGGRTRALVINPTDGSLWAGSPGGGLWKSTNQGATWTKVAGFNKNLTVSSILFANGKIYVGTGELAYNSRIFPLTISNLSSGYLGYSGFPGRGVFISSDNGASFSNDNATWPSNCENLNTPCFDVNTYPWLSVQKIIPARGKLYAATNRGLYYTTDDFATVTKDTFFMRPDLQSESSMWVKRNTGTTQTLKSTSFASEKLGITVGASGTILTTANGGYSWSSVSSGTANSLNGVVFSTNIIAWAVGDNGTLLKTEDAGATWASVSSGVTSRLNKISFYDANTGFIVGENGTILYTKDGGNTWTKSANVPTSNELSSVKFVKPQSSPYLIGIAVGMGGTILKSTDTSATWVAMNSGTTENLNDVSASPTRFFVVGNNSTVAYTAFAGTTWNLLNVSPCGTVNYNSAAFSIAVATGFIAGDNGTVLQTINASSASTITWECQQTYSNENIIGINYNTVSLGTAVGANGTIMTSIGGTNTAFASYKSSFFDKAIMDIEVGANDELYVTNGENYFISDNTTSPFVVYSPFVPGMGTTARIELATASSNKNIIYLAAARYGSESLSGVWKSSDKGYTWDRIGATENTTFAPATNTGKYSLSLVVDPSDDSHIFLGARQLWEYSTSQGWQRFTNGNAYYPGYPAYVPSFMHAIVFDPTNTNTMYIATDKEIVKSINKGRAFSIVSKNYNTSMLYSIGLGTNVYGEQDVYTIVHNIGLAYKNNPDKSSGIFNQMSPGGAGLVKVSRLNPQWVIYSDNAGATLNIYRSVNKGENFENFYDVPQGCTSPTFSYQSDLVYSTTTNAPVGATDASNINQFILDEVISDTLIEDSSEVRLGVNTPYLFVHTNKDVWLVNKPFGSSSDRPKWTRINNADVAASDDRISAMTISDDTTHTLYVGTKKGYIWRLKHAHDLCDVQQTLIFDPTNPGASPMTSRWISSLTIHPSDKNTLLVTYAGYEQQSLGLGRVFVTNDVTSAAPTFRSVSTDLPDYPVYCAFFHPATTQDWTVMLGTELGVWTSGADLTSNSTVTWDEINTGDMQRLPVYQIAFNYWKRKETFITSGQSSLRKTELVKDFGQPIYLATHGRGMMMVKEAVSREESVKPQVVSNLIKTYPNPSAEMTHVEFNLSQSTSKVTVTLMNIQGQAVYTSTLTQVGTGIHTMDIETRNLPSGIYIVKAEAQTHNGVLTQHNKLVVQH